MSDEQETEPRLVAGSVQLTEEQWAWLRVRMRGNLSRSVAAEVRRVVQGAMQAEIEEAREPVTARAA